MSTPTDTTRIAPYCMTMTLEIEPADEVEFNHLYDTDHLTSMIQVDGVLQAVRYQHSEPNAQGRLLYTAIYFLTGAEVLESKSWLEHANSGLWPTVMRPKLVSRWRTIGPVVVTIAKMT